MLSKLALAKALGFAWMLPEQASTYSADIDNLYLFMVGTTIFFTVLISGALIYFFIKYRRRSATEIPEPIAGSMALETLWTGIPFLIAMGMFAWGAKTYLDMYTIPNDASDIYVVGKQWMWKFQHPEGQREINELHVPVGKKIRLIMATEDVIHSFFVPAFRMKQDVVPGPNRYTTLWFEATKTGDYHIFCTEYCGTNHSAMIGWVNVMENKDYQAWLSGGNAEGSLAQRGASLFQELGCASCHRSDAQGQCPRLDGIYGKEQQLVGGQKVIVDDSYIRESILAPTAKVVAGFQPVMPTFQGQVSEEQLQQLIAYIKSIGPADQNAGNAGASGAKGNPQNPQQSNPVGQRPPIMSSGAPTVPSPQNEKAQEPMVAPKDNMQNKPANAR